MLRCRAHLCCCVRAAASVEASFDRLAQRRHLRAGACDWPAPKEDAGPSVSMRTVELCGRPSPRPLPGLRSASGSPRACLWFTRYHNRLRAAQSSVRLYRVLKSHQSLVRKSRARHGIVLPHGGWRMPAPASRRARGRLTSGEHPRRFSPHTLSSTSHPNAYLRWLRSEVQVSTFYSISTAAHVCPNDPPWPARPRDR